MKLLTVFWNCLLYIPTTKLTKLKFLRFEPQQVETLMLRQFSTSPHFWAPQPKFWGVGGRGAKQKKYLKSKHLCCGKAHALPGLLPIFGAHHYRGFCIFLGPTAPQHPQFFIFSARGLCPLLRQSACITSSSIKVPEWYENLGNDQFFPTFFKSLFAFPMETALNITSLTLIQTTFRNSGHTSQRTYFISFI